MSASPSTASDASTQTSTLDLETIFRFVTALRRGDFAARLPENLGVRAHDVAINLNSHARQMQELTSELTRVATEIGLDGRLGPQACAFMPPGPWKATVDAVNALAYELTGQLRDIHRSLKLAAAGDYSRPVTVPCQGEVAELAETVNALLARLAAAERPSPADRLTPAEPPRQTEASPR